MELRTAALLGDRPDTSATSYRVSPPSRTAVTVVALGVLTVAAWVVTVRQASDMTGMVSGLGQVGHRMPGRMGIARFSWMWAAMMVAMMTPTMAPVVLAHRAVATRRGEGVGSTVALAVGFLGVWSAVGALYLAPYLWLRQLPLANGGSRWLPTLAGVTLAAVGAYQFARRKNHCKEACGAPVSFVVDHDAGPGVIGGLRTGVVHGVHCLGCCWALMVVLLVVGLMNLWWMAALTGVFVLERHWPRSLNLSRAVGIALVVVGVAVMAWPGLLHRVSGTSGGPPAMSKMKM